MVLEHGIKQTVTQFQELMAFYEAGIEQVTTKLQILSKEFQCQNDRNPIESIHSRLKQPMSIAEKLQRKELEVTLNNIMLHLHDVAGVRVICPFIADVYAVANMLLNQSDVHVLEIKDYIKQPKENGYRSLHLIVEVEIHFSKGLQKVPVEVQLRTVAMNFWASLEHQMKYKKDFILTPAMEKELKACADTIARTDQRMQKLAGDIPAFFPDNSSTDIQDQY